MKILLRTLTLLAVIQSLRGPVTAQEDPQASVLMKTYDLERYAAVWQKSPFDAAAPIVEAKSFADSYVLAATVMIGDERFVTLIDRASNARIQLSTSAPVGDLRLVSIENSEDPKRTKVIIERGTERGNVGYDSTLLSATNSAGQPPPGPPPQQGQPPQMLPNGQPAQQQIRPGGAPPTRIIRRRIIPSQPAPR